MKTYSIGQVAKETNLTVYTLRYYDKEGLLPNIIRAENGIRRFQEGDIAALRLIECLKDTGMPIKDIKKFIDWCSQGDSTLEARHQMFLERRAMVLGQIAALQQVMEVIDYKCQYYQEAVDAGTEAVHHKNLL